MTEFWGLFIESVRNGGGFFEIRLSIGAISELIVSTNNNKNERKN